MRNTLMVYTAMLVLPATSVSFAQQAGAPTDTTPTQAAPQRMDVGYRGSSVDGDKARWERYRDLRDGPLLGLRGTRQDANAAFTFSAANVGYNDQQYNLAYNAYGKLKVNGSWNSIPLNYAYNTLSPWKYQGDNVFTLDPAARMLVQTKATGVLGIGQNATDYNNASIFRGLATASPMQARRDVANVGIKYRLSDVTSADLSVSTTKRSGNQPFAAAFAFSDANELPMELDNRTTDVTTALEWAKPGTGMVRVGWNGSWFENQFQTLTWDNPLRATDYSNGKLPPSGPYDGNGYSNGNGPALGRLALPPSNRLSSINLLGMYKMPSHTTLNGQLAFTTMKQNERLIPWTTNSVIASSAVYAEFPDLQSLPRATAEAEVRGINALLNFTTRPIDKLSFDARYRFNDHQNRTPIFETASYVRLDAVPEEPPSYETEHFNIRQNTFEGGASFTAPLNSTIRAGYILDDVQRDGRSFSGMRDNTFRLSVDSYRSQYLMVRGVYENTRRTGRGFSESALEDGEFQPGVRFFDEADMRRDKGMLILQTTPIDLVSLGLTVAAGKDRYSGAGHEFGLLDNNNASYNFSLDFFPTAALTFGATYGYEKFSTLQKSRNANPLSGVAGAYESWLDPNRDWNLDNDETVRNAGLYAGLANVLPNTDIKLSYDQSKSDNAYIFSGPRIQELITNTVLTAADNQKPCGTVVTSCFEQLPSITNNWQQLKADVTHMFNRKLGAGVSYWYEKFDIIDYSTTNLPDGSPRIDPLGAITTGYGNRPYKGQTGMLRLIYMF